MFSLSQESLQEVFVKDLRSLYDAEHQISDALPKMIKSASVGELKEALQEHLNSTQRQIDRLAQVFRLLQQKTERENCRGVQGILSEIDLVTARGKRNVIDARILDVVLKLEQYEIAAYDALQIYAELLGKLEVANLLRQTLEEEKETGSRLGSLNRNVSIEARAA